MVRVLVVDDQVLIRAGLAALLRAAPEIEVVGEADSGTAAVRLAAQHQPEVVLMDIRMHDMSGIEATRHILAQGGERAPRVLMLTTFDLDEYVYDALRAGAHGFLLKDTPPQRLIAAVTEVADGEMLFAPTVTRRLVESYTGRVGPQSGPRPELSALTSRESEVLRLIGTGLSNADIAAQLIISEATVKTHVNRTMAKLGLASRAQAVVLAYEAGLVTPGRQA
ncbi:DNA-binding response regulator [Actinoplanes ianthinogenes]|uniref:DNA-binding response regulator n=1 Tax=Actinoplanes ianthinogenes TaxID=122358 RepID=A0ABM7M970_9ACTN|nr:response regulator transcription factor [Actinoplanes ianthinogenes]BCJ48209.1 DNA-binding response regulator [Actinoplanes ianthinogenes]GGR07156.1 DNA-binding response regulator [Actinoplanes ianthinogenes]